MASCLLLLMHFVFMPISTHYNVSLSKCVCVYVCVCVPLHPWPFSEILHQGASIVVIQVASLLISEIPISGGVLSLDALPTTTARLSSSATAIADSAKTATVVTCLSEVFQISGFVVGCLDDMLNCFTRLLVLVA